MAEREGGEISGDEGDRTQTEGRKIQDQDDGVQWEEEVHKWLMVKAACLYASDGVVASTDLGWPQSTFGFLTGLFDRVGLRTNICNTVGMVCRPFWAAGVRVDEAYTRRMTRDGRSFKKWKRERVSCP